jgi:hypothetical protein
MVEISKFSNNEEKSYVKSKFENVKNSHKFFLYWKEKRTSLCFDSIDLPQIINHIKKQSVYRPLEFRVLLDQ